MSTRYYPALDSLRGICALMVTLFHLRANSHIEDLLLVRNGWLFVDFFFVLSGFVIAQSYRHRLASGQVSIGQFMWLRLARIYPLHLFMLGLFVVSEYIISQVYTEMGAGGRAPFTEGRSLALLPENILLLQSFGVSGTLSWNVPAWSISAEVWTYLLFALTISLMGRWVWFGLCGLVVPVLILWLHGPSIDLEFDGGVLRCLLGFGLGVFLSEFSLPQRLGERRARQLELPALGVILLFVAYGPAAQLTLLAPLVFSLMLICFAQSNGPVSRQICRGPFLWLGLLSYSIYMVHTYVHARCKNFAMVAEKLTGTSLFHDEAKTLFGPSLWLGDLFVAAALLLSIAISYLTWKLVEKPAQAYLRALYSATSETSQRSQGSQS